MYNTLKFIHILSIIILVGGVHAMLILNARIGKAGNPAFAGMFMEQNKFMAMRVYIPAALVALITGIGMAQVGHLGFSPLWIQYGIGGLILGMVIGNAVIGRMAAKLMQQVAAGTIAPADAMATRKKIAALAGFNLLLMISIVFVMVFKPV
jgi:uncharacterized membrane protein